MQPRISGLAFLAFASLILASTDARSTVQRTFVASSGNDANPCSLALPCRGFAAAVAQTSTGGEVIALDSAGYGPVVITHSVSIIAPAGVYAGITVTSGNGVSIATIATDSVTLRGLTINDMGTGVRGIDFEGDGRLQIEDVQVTGFHVCLYFSAFSKADLIVQRSSFSGGAYYGIVAGTASGSGNVAIDHVAVHHSGADGILIQDGMTAIVSNSTMTHNGGYGVWSAAAVNTAEVAVRSSEISHNGYGAVAGGVGIPGVARLSIVDSTIAHNGTGVQAADGGTLILSGATISQNTIGIAYGGSGAANSQGNNLISANGTDGGAPTIVGPK